MNGPLASLWSEAGNFLDHLTTCLEPLTSPLQRERPGSAYRPLRSRREGCPCGFDCVSGLASTPAYRGPCSTFQIPSKQPPSVGVRGCSRKEETMLRGGAPCDCDAAETPGCPPCHSCQSSAVTALLRQWSLVACPSGRRNPILSTRAAWRRGQSTAPA